MNPLSSLTIETFKIYKHFLIHGFKLFRNEILAHFNEENTEIKDVQTSRFSVILNCSYKIY